MKHTQCDRTQAGASIAYEKPKQGGAGPAKSEIIERNYYQCFCARNYQSYSALYLHVKLKHNQNLSFKSLRQKYTEWSGSVKNVYFQFVEADGQENPNFQKISLNLRKRERRRRYYESDDESGPAKQKTEKTPPHSGTPKLKAEQPNISNILATYEHQKRDQHSVWRSSIFSELMDYVNFSYKEVLGESREIDNYCFSEDCEALPLFLNGYVKEYHRDSSENRPVIQELLDLSTWLFQNGKSKYLAVEYDAFTE